MKKQLRKEIEEIFEYYDLSSDEFGSISQILSLMKNRLMERIPKKGIIDRYLGFRIFTTEKEQEGWNLAIDEFKKIIKEEMK